ncbi:MAG TPA: hypothetical protein VFX75_04560 [Nitrososphaeraceae archaeon]|nr:hypothetical protein [Nitrososphaeraceae archaeon]
MKKHLVLCLGEGEAKLCVFYCITSIPKNASEIAKQLGHDFR